MTELVLSTRAKTDLEDIWRYSAIHWSPNQADNYILELLSVCDDLAEGHRKGRSADDIKDGLFRILARSHVVYFQLEAPDDLVIVRILHGSMDPTLHL